MGLIAKIKDKVKHFNFFLVIVSAYAVYVTFFSDYNYIKVMEYDAQIRDLKAQIKQCDDSCAVYKQRLHDLNSDPETTERIVREEYKMKRDNEDLYIVNE